jgi:ribosomal protein L29
MNTSDLQQKNDTDLVTMITEMREELRKLRFGTAGSVRNSHAVRNLRRDIARALTELNKRSKVGA